jgi:hypothetical protein
MGRSASHRRQQEGFAVLQLFIVIAIVLLVVGMAVPVYAAMTKQSVLLQNAQSLALEAKSSLALDLDPTYAPASAERGVVTTMNAQNVSLAIEAALRDGRAGGPAGHYVNPTNGSEMIVNQKALPTGSASSPAVWMTDDVAYSYSDFASGAEAKAHLAGTLVVAFVVTHGRTSAIDVFYVDATGVKSPEVTTLAI